MLDVSSVLLAQITAAAAASPGVEVCGLLLGAAGRVEAVVPAANVAADPSRWFEIDPAALLAAHRAARRGGPAVIGHYHSHPSGDAAPSPRDAAAAAPDGGIWLIVGGDRVTAWRALPQGPLHGRFEPVTLRIG